MPTADTDTDLPVPVDSARTHVDVVPAGDALDPATVETHLRPLHRLGSDESTGFLSRLRGVPSLPTNEFLLANLDALLAGLASTDQEKSDAIAAAVMRSPTESLSPLEADRTTALLVGQIHALLVTSIYGDVICSRTTIPPSTGTGSSRQSPGSWRDLKRVLCTENR